MTDNKFPATALPWLLLAILFTGCGPAEKPEPPPNPRCSQPRRGLPGERRGPLLRQYPALRPRRVGFQVGGYLTNILQVKGVDGKMRNVHQGDYVKRGAVLAQVRQSDYEAKLAQAAGQNATTRAALEKANLDLVRATEPVCGQ